MAEPLCVVVGYFETPFSQHAELVKSKGVSSPEFRIFQRNHLVVADRPLPYLDVLNFFLSKSENHPGHSADDMYHLGEVSNLAALYLTSFLRQRGHNAEFVGILPAEFHRLKYLLAADEPLVVAITTTFYLTPLPVIELTSLVRRLRPDATVVVGGPLIVNLMLDCDQTTLDYVLAQMGADIYVRESQGESTLEVILNHIRGKLPLSNVANCYILESGEYRFTRSRPENNPMDSCSIDWKRFEDWELGESVQMRTARSCAFKCSFCDYPVRAGSLSLASIATVEKELLQLAQRGVHNIIFIDDTFNVPEPRFRDLCEMMIRRDFDFQWFSYFRCSSVKKKTTFDLLAASGCAGVFLGVESADDQVLLNMNKRATVDQYRRSIDELHERGIPTFASLITGFPGETEKSIGRTISFLNEAAPTFYRAEPYWHNRRAPVAAMAAQFKLEGDGYQWKHQSMDVHAACDSVDRIFNEVRTSLWMPMYMFDFWALPYLLGKGMKLEEIAAFHRHAGAALAARSDKRDPTPFINTLSSLCSSLTLRPARLQRPTGALAGRARTDASLANDPQPLECLPLS